MNKASKTPFEGMAPVLLVQEMRKMQRDRKVATDEKESLNAKLERLAAIPESHHTGTDKAEHDRLFREAEESAKQEKAAQRWREANVPARHAQAKVAAADARGLNWKVALTQARKSVTSNGQIVLLGGCGAGKTQIAVEIIREVTTAGKSALFTTATRLLREIKACYRDETKTTETQVIAAHIKPWLLVIDEFHRRKGSDWENEQLFDLINERYNAMKATILICNQTPQEFEEAMDGAILDRMNETGGKIHCNWPSFR